MEQNFLMRKYLHRLAQNVAGLRAKYTPVANNGANQQYRGKL
jgi:hypothetical protein